MSPKRSSKAGNSPAELGLSPKRSSRRDAWGTGSQCTSSWGLARYSSTCSTLPPYDQSDDESPMSPKDSWSSACFRALPTAVEDCSADYQAPEPRRFNIMEGFPEADVRPWDNGRFAMVRTIQVAPRNHGHVLEMCDIVNGQRLAMKHMPAAWVCQNQEDFTKTHPQETEKPWVDLGAVNYLTDVGYPYICSLMGVFRDSTSMYVMTELATEGDLFGWAKNLPEEPGPMREAVVQPVARQLMDAVRMLHNLGITHGDISAENIVLTRECPDGPLQVRLIDFAMSATCRFARGNEKGKRTCQAPEQHSGKPYDAFLADAFAVGVVLYGILMLEYPWNSTKADGCKAFAFYQKYGFRALIARRKCFGRPGTIAERMSEPLTQFLEGLLAISPSDRLSLGEASWMEFGQKPSVWAEPWVSQGATDCWW